MDQKIQAKSSKIGKLDRRILSDEKFLVLFFCYLHVHREAEQKWWYIFLQPEIWAVLPKRNQDRGRDVCESPDDVELGLILQNTAPLNPHNANLNVQETLTIPVSEIYTKKIQKPQLYSNTKLFN
jgi:hypothetical protein